jgi:hypothetical protein
MNWHRHFFKMGENRLTKILLDLKPEGYEGGRRLQVR